MWSSNGKFLNEITSVNKDTDGGNDEPSVKTTDSVGSKSLLVDIDETFVFTLTTFALISV